MSDSFSRALSDSGVRNARPRAKAYKLADGGGLFLLVQPNGTKLWRYKFRLNAVEGLDSLGAYPEVSLSAARNAHRESRALVSRGTHPTKHRQEARAAAEMARLEAELGVWHQAVASWRAKADQGRAASTVDQREREIAKYLTPVLKGRIISTIKRVELAKLLADVQSVAAEVAKNLRGYLDGIFEHAIDIGLVEANPTPPRRTLNERKSQRRTALALADLGAFLSAVRDCTAEPATKAAMQLVVLTAGRKAEITGARWDEFDLAAGVWLVPAHRMKGRREHWVPLPRQAVAILRELRRQTNGDFVFPHRHKADTPMAERTLNMLMKRLGYKAPTVHGFRSVFSTRFNALGPMNADVVEKCLAHVPKDQVRAAYNRHEYQDERRVMIQEWADYVDGITAGVDNVVRLAA